ncbi:MAG: hypothetical protein ACK5Y2_05025 [Bdellovibrionales bacterium]
MDTFLQEFYKVQWLRSNFDLVLVPFYRDSRELGHLDWQAKYRGLIRNAKQPKGWKAVSSGFLPIQLDTAGTRLANFILKNDYQIILSSDLAGICNETFRRVRKRNPETKCVLLAHGGYTLGREHLFREAAKKDIESLSLRERAAAKAASSILFPTKCALDWFTRAHQISDKNCEVLNWPFNKKRRLGPKLPKRVGWAFYAKLENRKGLDLFLSYLEKNLGPSAGAPSVVFLIGPSGVVMDIPSWKFIDEFKKAHPFIRIETVAGLKRDDALKFIERTCSRVYLPSRFETFGYALVEVATHTSCQIFCSAIPAFLEVAQRFRLRRVNFLNFDKSP